MATYSQLKAAVGQEIVTHFTSLGIDSSHVIFSNLDELIKNIKTNDSTYAIYLEFGNAGRQKREVFASREWLWTIAGVLMIAFKGNLDTLEIQLSQAIDLLRTLFKGNETLGGITSFASIDTIESADPITFADMPFYWVPFAMTFVDKM